MGEGVVGWVAQTGQTLIVPDAYAGQSPRCVAKWEVKKEKEEKKMGRQTDREMGRYVDTLCR